MHHVEIVKPSDPHARRDGHSFYEVWLNGKLHSHLVSNGMGFTGSLPTYEGAPVRLGTCGIGEWKREASVINRRSRELAISLQSAPGDSAMRSGWLTPAIIQARDIQNQFFDEIGLSRTDVMDMSDAERVRLQEDYGEWLGRSELLFTTAELPNAPIIP